MQDAVPDEVELVSEDVASIARAKSHVHRPGTAGESSIPMTVVDKVDPASPSHGDVPRTVAHTKRKADAVPDVIRSVSSQPESSIIDGSKDGVAPPEMPVPTTVITRVDSEPSHGEIPGTEAYDIRKSDAKADIVEKKGDIHSE